jgi:uncharacterized protein
LIGQGEGGHGLEKFPGNRLISKSFVSRQLTRMVLVLMASAIMAGCSSAVPQDGLPMPGVLPGTAAIYPQMTTFRDQTFVNVVRQHTDFSCGAAALATILRYGYDLDITEKEVFLGMYAVSDKATVRERGFSLLDMKKYLETIGMQGVGFKISADALTKVKVPVIVLLNLNGYEHFVVMRKATPNGVYVADPALGNRVMPNDLFYVDWQLGVIFAVIGPKYNPENVLVMTEKPLGTKQQTRNLMPAFIPVSQQFLSSATVIPGLNLGNK